jgi:hypothetical protein
MHSLKLGILRLRSSLAEVHSLMPYLSLNDDVGVEVVGLAAEALNSDPVADRSGGGSRWCISGAVRVASASG